MQDWHKLAEALNIAWAALPPDERARLEPEIRREHEALLSIRAGVAPSSPPSPELALAYSLLNDDPDDVLRDATTGSVDTWVGPDGQVYFGGVGYDATDFGWLYCPLAWYLTDGKAPEFAIEPVTLKIPDTVTIALLGDWGGNNAAARDVAASAGKLLGPGDIMVHLGDVYYAGTNMSGLLESDYQQTNFLNPWPWPETRGKSFALNSNHDMYAHGTGYFETALASPLFASQSCCSYFALYNDRFRIVGLDTAYFDPEQTGWNGFMRGSLGPTGTGTQAQFLNEQASAAAAAEQQLILLTHHNGFAYDLSATFTLWDEVTTQLAPLAGASVIWYWGHEHMGVVYDDRVDENKITIRPRCCGHSCIPWGIATGLQVAGVEWYEKAVPPPGGDYFVANGFATLTLDNSSISEAFYRQDGTKSWSDVVSV